MSDFRPRGQFLYLEPQYTQPDSSTVWILPLPLEITTCYIGGTARGPLAILEASLQVEVYDADVDADAANDYGIYTLPHFLPPLTTVEGAVQAIAAEVRALPLHDKLLVTLGGEHSITPGLVEGITAFHHDLLIVQLDAHSDLRDSYEGTPHSHACAMRRCLEIPHVAGLLAFGIRSQSSEEMEFMRATDRVRMWTAEAMYRDRRGNYLKALQQAVAGRNVYLTLDVDGLDPSVIPATGTPVPGGVGWYEALGLIRAVASSANVVAFDCVELAPAPNADQLSAHTTAVLVYKTINAIMQARGKVGAL
jgi:agmatinase